MKRIVSSLIILGLLVGATGLTAAHGVKVGVKTTTLTGLGYESEVAITSRLAVFGEVSANDSYEGWHVGVRWYLDQNHVGPLIGLAFGQVNKGSGA